MYTIEGGIRSLHPHSRFRFPSFWYKRQKVSRVDHQLPPVVHSTNKTRKKERNNLLKMNSFRVFVFFFGTISTFGSAWQQPVMMTPAWTSSGMPTADQQMTPNNQDQLWRKVSLLTAHKP
jgi:hypothetical protein